MFVQRAIRKFWIVSVSLKTASSFAGHGRLPRHGMSSSWEANNGSGAEIASRESYTSLAHHQHDNDVNQKRKRPRRPNRPGLNSYLKVLLDDQTLDFLHQLSLGVRDKIHEANNQLQAPLNEEAKVDAGLPGDSLSSESVSNPEAVQSKKLLSYRPRPRESLHLTLFFGGETICALPEDELRNWHSRVEERLGRSAFMLEGADLNEIPDSADLKLDFTVRGLRVFPPQRNSLVVAILEAEAEWNSIYSDLRSIASDDTCSPELSRAMEYDTKDKWIAHVTLGNLGGGTKVERKDLDAAVLQQVFDAATLSTQAHVSVKTLGTQAHVSVKTLGITMGGPVPDQVSLDWNFILRRQEWPSPENSRTATGADEC